MAAQRQPIQKESKAGAGVVGAGGGTLLVAFAKSFPEESAVRDWLLLVSPVISVILAALWLWCQIELANWMRDRKIRILVDKSRASLVKALGNPSISEGHKQKIQKRLEEIDLIISDRNLERIKSLEPIREEDFSG